jgi:hypothetical protein
MHGLNQFTGALHPRQQPNAHAPALHFLVVKLSHGKLSASLDAANQALFNICAWMIIVRPETDFLQNVRTFSVVANTDEIVARIHHATALECSEHDTPLQLS